MERVMLGAASFMLAVCGLLLIIPPMMSPNALNDYVHFAKFVGEVSGSSPLWATIGPYAMVVAGLVGVMLAVRPRRRHEAR